MVPMGNNLQHMQGLCQLVLRRRTCRSFAPLMTWKLVTMCPSVSHTKPEPAPWGISIMSSVKASRLCPQLGYEIQPFPLNVLLCWCTTRIYLWHVHHAMAVLSNRGL